MFLLAGDIAELEESVANSGGLDSSPVVNRGPDTIPKLKTWITEDHFINPSLVTLEKLRLHKYTHAGLIFSIRCPHMRNRDAQRWALECVIAACAVDRLPTLGIAILEDLLACMQYLPDIVANHYPDLACEYGTALVTLTAYLVDTFEANVFGCLGT